MRKAGVQTGAVGGISGLGEFPGRTGLDVGVHGADEDPEGFEGVADLVFGERFVVLLNRIAPELAEIPFEIFVGRGGGNQSGIITTDHVEESVDEVSEIIAEVSLIAVFESRRGEIGVLSDDHLSAEVVPECIGTMRGGEAEGVGRIAGALGSFLVIDRPPTVDEQLARGLDAEGLKHAGPVDGVGRRQDVLADDMHVGGPKSLIGDGGVVVS